MEIWVEAHAPNAELQRGNLRKFLSIYQKFSVSKDEVDLFSLTHLIFLPNSRQISPGVDVHTFR
jgi:hypothetical protein